MAAQTSVDLTPLIPSPTVEASKPESKLDSPKISPPIPDSGASETVHISSRFGDIALPESAMIGSLGDAAREIAKGTEIPPELVFASLLAEVGLMVSGKLTLNVGLHHDTRLFTILLGDSADGKKSSALREAQRFLDPLASELGSGFEMPFVLEGVGSAEGLAGALNDHRRTLLVYDETRAFVDKSKIQGSVLLPMVTKLFEEESYDNFTSQRQISIRGAKLGFIGCATTETYENMFTSDAIDIGFPNRLFIVGASHKPKVLFPGKRDEIALQAIRKHLSTQLSRPPKEFDITTEAQAELDDWYKNLPRDSHAKRLDTILRGLLPVLALISDKDEIDLEVAKVGRQIIEYEYRIRKLVDPVDAEGPVAKMEEKIRRYLASHGPTRETHLKRAVNYARSGIYVFKRAMSNLEDEGEISIGKTVQLLPRAI